MRSVSTSLRLPSHLTVGDGVVGVILERDALGSPAALADAPLVVAQNEEIPFRELPGQLREQRNAGDRDVAIDGTGSGDQDDGRMPQPALSRRRRQRARQAEAGGRDDDLAVGRVAQRLLPCFDAGEILTGDRYTEPRHIGLGEAAAFVDRHFDVERPGRMLERQREAPGLERSGRRLIGGWSHRLDDGLALSLRRHVNRQLAARRHGREADGESLICREEVARHDHRARGDLIGLAGGDAVLRHLVDRRRGGERCRQPEHPRLGLGVAKVGDSGVDFQFDGLPVGRVGQLEALVDQVQRCAQRAGRGNRPAGRGSRQVRLFAADRAAVDEDDIRGLAGDRNCGRCRLLRAD